MDCPSCKHPNAYVGFSTIECRNAQCKHAGPVVDSDEYIRVTVPRMSFPFPPMGITFTHPPTPLPVSVPDYIIQGHELYRQVAGPNTGNYKCDLCQRYYNNISLVTANCTFSKTTGTNPPLPPTALSSSSLPIKASNWPSPSTYGGTIVNVNGTLKYIDSDGNVTSVTGGSGPYPASVDPGAGSMP